MNKQEVINKLIELVDKEMIPYDLKQLTKILDRTTRRTTCYWAYLTEQRKVSVQEDFVVPSNSYKTTKKEAVQDLLRILETDNKTHNLLIKGNNISINNCEQWLKDNE